MVEPPQITAAFAEYFGATKADFFVGDGATGERALRQTGAAYLVDGPSEPALAWPTEVIADEPLIETFVVDAEGTCMPTGSDAALIDAWRPAATQLASTVLAATTAMSIPVVGPAYLTATVTPADQITGLAHFDDDVFLPTAGAGFVAIIGSLAGPRVATQPVPQAQPRPGAQLTLSDGEIERFETGDLASQSAAPDRIVAFPQFGQLHAGPRIARARSDEMRHLLVFRAATAPA